MSDFLIKGKKPSSYNEEVLQVEEDV